MTTICTCDSAERRAAGVKEVGGVERCGNCGRPTSQIPVEYKAWMDSESRPASVQETFVTTLQALDGQQVVESFGVVTSISSSAGRGAQAKGSIAMESAMVSLRRAAGDRGANAVVGLQVAPFAASVGGNFGDAVGILLAGTAVRVEQLTDEKSKPRHL